MGKKALIDKLTNVAFIRLKFKLRKLPGYLLLEQIQKFKPVLSYVRKRMGRKFNPIPIPIHYKRQYILSIRYVSNFVKNASDRRFIDRLVSALGVLFETKRNFITRLVATDIKNLAEARFYSHLR